MARQWSETSAARDLCGNARLLPQRSATLGQPSLLSLYPSTLLLQDLSQIGVYKDIRVANKVNGFGLEERTRRRKKVRCMTFSHGISQALRRMPQLRILACGISKPRNQFAPTHKPWLRGLNLRKTVIGRGEQAVIPCPAQNAFDPLSAPPGARRVTAPHLRRGGPLLIQEG
jgi:hypothetical protein